MPRRSNSPLTPKQQSVQVLLNEPSLVTDQIQKAWAQARPQICAALIQEMGKGKFAAGQTLRDIKCFLDERTDFTVANSGPGALAVSLAVGGAIEATSTTPTPLDSYAIDSHNFSGALAVKPLPGAAASLQKKIDPAALNAHPLSPSTLTPAQVPSALH
jgi:hypothetical protein